MKVVEWSEDDGCYIGSCPGLMLGGVHGDDEAQVYAELCRVVDEWIDIYRQDGDALPPPTAGKKYSGKFVIRIGRDLHQALALLALRAGESLNTYCAKALKANVERELRSPGHKSSACENESTARADARARPGARARGAGPKTVPTA